METVTVGTSGQKSHLELSALSAFVFLTENDVPKLLLALGPLSDSSYAKASGLYSPWCALSLSYYPWAPAHACGSNKQHSSAGAGRQRIKHLNPTCKSHLGPDSSQHRDMSLKPLSWRLGFLLWLHHPANTLEPHNGLRYKGGGESIKSNGYVLARTGTQCWH